MSTVLTRKKIEAVADALSALAARVHQEGTPGPLILLAGVAFLMRSPRALNLDPGLSSGFLNSLTPMFGLSADYPYDRLIDLLTAIAEDTGVTEKESDT